MSASTSVIVFVDDGNDVPQIADHTISLDENSPAGTVAARANAFDPDAGQTLTYSIVSGNAAGGFAIDSQTGWITVANEALLDYETTRAFVLTVQVVDNGSPVLSSTAVVTINLNDINELATFDDSGPFGVDENVASGTMVGRVSASDPDNGQQLTYAITTGNVGGAFAIDPLTGEITVANAAALDFETRPTFTLTIQASDDGSPMLGVATSVTITLRDVNDGPVLDNAGAMSLMPINQGASTIAAPSCRTSSQARVGIASRIRMRERTRGSPSSPRTRHTASGNTPRTGERRGATLVRSRTSRPGYCPPMLSCAIRSRPCAWVSMARCRVESPSGLGTRRLVPMAASRILRSMAGRQLSVRWRRPRASRSVPRLNKSRSCPPIFNHSSAVAC